MPQGLIKMESTKPVQKSNGKALKFSFNSHDANFFFPELILAAQNHIGTGYYKVQYVLIYFKLILLF
jgi:hypothetical protein